MPHLEWNWDTLLSGHVLTQLLVVMSSAVVLQVDNPALHILDCLTFLLEGGGNCLFTAEMFILLFIHHSFKNRFYLVSNAATH